MQRAHTIAGLIEFARVHVQQRHVFVGQFFGLVVT